MPDPGNEVKYTNLIQITDALMEEARSQKPEVIGNPFIEWHFIFIEWNHLYRVELTVERFTELL